MRGSGPVGLNDICSIRLDTMSGALIKLGRDDFLLIAINADNINYLPVLHVMRKVTSTPIYIITTDFHVADQVVSLKNGADVYAPFHGSTKENVE